MNTCSELVPFAEVLMPVSPLTERVHDGAFYGATSILTLNDK